MLIFLQENVYNVNHIVQHVLNIIKIIILQNIFIKKEYIVHMINQIC